MDKLPVFDWFITQGDIYVTVDITFPDVDVPVHLREHRMVDFILGLSPTPKLQADANGILVNMRFSGAPYTCFFPWGSVARISGQGAVMSFAPQAHGKGAGTEKDDSQPPPSDEPRQKGRMLKRIK